MGKISALIITKNEEEHIEALIENLSFADELIIVDSLSTDKTKEICQKYPHVQFYEHPFEDYASQRNIAISYASHEWILFLDADERLSNKLKNEIVETIKKPTFKAYYFKRRFYFSGKPVYFGGLQVDKNIRLFKREIGKFKFPVHEKLDYDGPIGTLNHFLDHFSYANYEDFKQKWTFYGKLKGIDAYNKGKKYYPLMHVLHPTFTFINRLFIRLGILDGVKGVIVCYVISYSVWIRYNELKKRKNHEKNH